MLFIGCHSLYAQQHNNTYISEGDTLRYSYTPIAQPLPVDTLKRKNFIHRIINYFEQAAVDRTFEKKIDITFAGGPSYSKNTSLGLAVLAAGLYRLDRTDSITAPSDVSIFVNASIAGMYAIGIYGNNIFSKNRQKVDYEAMFSSQPVESWGVGYHDGRYNPSGEYVEKHYLVRARYLHRIFNNTYVGGLVNFEHTAAKKLDLRSESYLYGERPKYTTTGVGLIAEYDSRDFIPNPHKGLYVSLQYTLYPKGLGTCDRTLGRLNVTADYYRRVSPSSIIAVDLYGEYNSAGTPWPMLSHMGGTERMRGYYQGRYTDRGMITFQVELRQHVWRRFGATVWCGAGNVFRDLQMFSWSHTLPNYGVGVRWELKKRVNVRIDYGFGKSTSGFMLGLNEAF